MNFLFNNSKARRPVLFAYDMLCFAFIDICYYFASGIFKPTINSDPDIYAWGALILFISVFSFRHFLNVYSNVWRFTSTKAYFCLIVADLSGAAVAYILSRAFNVYETVWHFANVSTFTLLLAILSRLTYRLIYKHHQITSSVETAPAINVAIVGAGQLGVLLAAELVNNRRSIYKPLFFIDNDKSKVGKRVYGLPVYYEDASVLSLIKRESVSEVFIAVSKLDNEDAARVYDFYRLTGCKIKIYDFPIHDAENVGALKPTIRDFQIEDLLFRDPVDMASSEDFKYYSGKTVLVTGGGGSIGSELCRRIAECSPKRLVIFDIYENNAYDIQQELSSHYPHLDLCVEIGSVRDRERLDCVFRNYRPSVVFHAAAHKHVPLMEQSGCEAVKNNVIGTYNTADIAEKYGVEKFILISSDKAVNPTNIMGATKRICEMIILCRTDSKTAFSAVRFGNVLGSNGSVIPLFKRQIASGGPVTLTDKRIIRYFMTVTEASHLVMEAGAMAKSGELFVLDMGKPVRIYDLAEKMIILSGLEPGVDIKIQEIGLRPGEKLYEELLIKTETLDKTENNMIFIERDAPITRAEVEDKLSLLVKAVKDSETFLGSDIIKRAISEVVPTFHDPFEVNQKASESSEIKSAQKYATVPPHFRRGAKHG